MNKTTMIDAERNFEWYRVDASHHRLGHLAVAIAETLMGKRKASYTPHLFSGDGVVVTNAAKVQTSGMKHKRRKYRFYSGYLGGLKEISLGDLRDKNPRKLITIAVRRMLPKTRLGRSMLKRLKVYEGAEHPHVAQSPTEIVVKRPRWKKGHSGKQGKAGE